MRKLWHIAALGLALALAGCKGMATPPRVGPPPPQVEDDEAEARFAEVFGRWTRRAELYQGFDSLVFIGATFLSMEFRQARVTRLAAFQKMPEPEAQALLALERTQNDEALEFLVGVHANEKRFDDFGRRNSIWRVALITESGEVLPTSIERLRRLDPNMRAVFPYIEQFWSAYLIRFPRTRANGSPVLPQRGQVTLRLSSTLGMADLLFDIEPLPGDSARSSD